ncbi:MAG TPA: hypothetical protein VKA46_10805 [Gemmataceae bacterium]|nr:hypothetical protein [Gemmataceae bacterium]
MMKDDPTIKAVRDARRRISALVGHDPRKLVEHYRQLQERHRERLISHPPQHPGTEGETAA